MRLLGLIGLMIGCQTARPQPEPLLQSRVGGAPPSVAPSSTTHWAGPRAKADLLYRRREFDKAAATLLKAAQVADEADARELEALGGAYVQLGKRFHVGMAPGTKPIEAFRDLRQARDFDRALGGALADVIGSRLAGIAPRAAVSYMANQAYPEALLAVRVAESLNAANASTTAVRAGLETKAADLYQRARAQWTSDPEDALAALRQIIQMTEHSSRWHRAAELALTTGQAPAPMAP